MGKRAPRTANAVSLFPFLAVLICAMGALILLLLVTTRRIRHQQSRAAAVVAPLPVDSPKPQEPSEPDAPPEPSPPAALTEYLVTPLQPLFALDPAPQFLDPNVPWRNRLQALAAEHTRLAAAIGDRESVVEQLRSSTAAMSQELEALRQQAAAIEQDKQDLERSFAKLQQDALDSDDRAAYLRRKIDETREQLAHANSKYSIMPFDGRLGTTRRPIILECSEDAITFVSEGVSLKARDLDGFTPRYNPLLIASSALSKYWARKDRLDDADTDGDPYVLLVVRPKGTIAYYAARKLLGLAHENFGYELVRDDQEFAWPASDPAATHICREIVDRMLAERDALFAMMPEGAQQHAREYSSPDGAFRLEEIERVRNPGRGVTINGQRFLREPLAATTPNLHGLGRNADSPLMPVVQPTDDPGAPRRLQGPEHADDDRFGDAAADGDNADAAFTGLRPLTPGGSTHPLRSPSPDGTNPDELSSHSRSPFADFARESRSGAAGPNGGGTASLSSQGDLRSTEQGGGGSAPRGREGNRQDSEETLDLVPVSRRDAPAGADGQSPQWGIRRPGGLIGFEREVLVRVTAAQVTIADETSFAIAPGMSSDELRKLFAAHLNHQVRSWGEPPRSFYWLPTVNFMVSPGGIQFYERLKNTTTEHWKLRSTVKHVLE
ncbi:MAG: hypothetical protein AB7U20_04600 [Planctomycetaceae bacterium]